MTNEPNTNFDPTGLRLSVRQDLSITPRADEAEPYFLIEDPIGSKFFRVGPAEHAFLSRLDGRTTVAEAAAAVERQMPAAAFSPSDGLALCRWLLQVDLAHIAGQTRDQGAAAPAGVAGGLARLSRFNVLTVRIPLLRPDRLFDALTPYLSWIYSARAFLIWLPTVLIAAYLLSGEWAGFVASTSGILAPGNWLWLAVCWLVLKIVHEVSHGVVCKRYGGDVREAGVLLILLFPAAYVDVTSCWRFPSRWQRIHTAVAGMYAELLVAAAAAILWTRLPPGPLNHLCANIVVMASLTTVLFNANPLMRFDGYYILSDLLGIHNLYSRGQQRLSSWVRRYLFGVNVFSNDEPGRGRRAIAVYGVLSFAWRVMVCAGLIISASALFAGAGIVIAVVALTAWLLPPIVRLARYLVLGTAGERPSLFRFAWAGSLAVACVVVPLCTVPWPGARAAPAIVEHAPLTIVRASSRGFVRVVHVIDGQRVREGQVLVELENRELQMELNDLELGIQQLDLKRRSLANSHRMAELQAHDEHRAALNAKLTEKQTQADRLLVRAPRTGTVLGRDALSLIGSYVDEGAQIFAIVDDRGKELQVSVAQQDMDPFTASLGQPVRVRLPGGSSFEATLTELSPRADLELVSPALSAALGGPLAVRLKQKGQAGREAGESKYELFSARFTGTVQLAEDRSESLRAGQRGVVSLKTHFESIGSHFYRTASHWIRDRVRRAFGRESA